MNTTFSKQRVRSALVLSFKVSTASLVVEPGCLLCTSLHGKFYPCFVSLRPSTQTLVALAAAARRAGGGSRGVYIAW